MKKGLFLGIGLFLITLLLSPSAYAEIKISDSFSLYGDGRGRFELDDRKTTSATQERDRFRYRLRVGFKYAANEYVELGARLGTGDTLDANSPHVVFGSDRNNDNHSNSSAPYALTPDWFTINKAYIKGKYAGGFAWIGKESMPFWKQNEYFWDDDINPEGIAAGYTVKNLGPLSITLHGGYFMLDEGGWFTSGKGDPDDDMTTYQIVASGGFSPADFTLAYGVLNTTDGASARSQGATTTTNNSYTDSSIEVKIKAIPGVGLNVGYDYYNSDAKTKSSGSVITVGASYGNLFAKFYSIDIDTNAVTAFAQDDWANYYNDMSGYEINLGYKFTKNINADIKRFAASKKSNTSIYENRTQINLNVSF